MLWTLRDFIKGYDRRLFWYFKKKYLRMSRIYFSSMALTNNGIAADIYITGSDQVWGPWYKLGPFFLTFVNPEKKKIAYAASFGRDYISPEEKDEVSSYLRGLTSIGVREVSGKKICEEINAKEVKLVPDPTLLLTRKEWSQLFVSTKHKRYPYKKFLFYKVGAQDAQLFKSVVASMCDINSYYFVSASSHELVNIYPTVEIWLKLISESGLVVTNSFHGTVFCLLFNTPFITLERTAPSEKSMNTRLVSLLNIFSLSERLISNTEMSSINYLIEKEIDWGCVNSKMHELRNEGYDFLEKSIF